MESNIDQLGKGAKPQPHDSRDYQAAVIFGFPMMDFSAGFRLPEPPDENQNGSSSCVSQAWSYYHWQLKSKDYSRRSLYSRIFLPEGGAYLRDGGKELTSTGQATRDEAQDPHPEAEMAMRYRLDITEAQEASDIEHNYFSLSNDINTLAYCIQAYKGVVFGVRGTNRSWGEDYTNPKIPAPDDYDFWHHALYGMGYHLHDEMEECIIAKSSWCGSQPGHHEHHIKKSYFDAGGTFDAWVLIPKEEVMSNVKIGIRDVPGQIEKEISLVLPITSPDALVSYSKNFGITIPLTPDGKPDFTKLKPDYTLIPR